MSEKVKDFGQLQEPKFGQLKGNIVSWFCIALFLGLGIREGIEGRWGYVAWDIGLIVLNLLTISLGYFGSRRTYRLQKRLVTLRCLLTTPSMREDGYSVILTFLAPSPALEAEIKKRKA